jgi:hypothetical protein
MPEIHVQKCPTCSLNFAGGFLGFCSSHCSQMQMPTYRKHGKLYVRYQKQCAACYRHFTPETRDPLKWHQVHWCSSDCQGAWILSSFERKAAA